MTGEESSLFRLRAILLWLLIFRFSTEWAYSETVVPRYGYFGLVMEPDIRKAALSLVLIVITAITAPRDKRRPSTYLFLLLVLFVLSPIFSLYWMVGTSTAYTLFVFVCGLIVSGLLHLRLPLGILSQEAIHQHGRLSGSRALLSMTFVVYMLGGLMIVASRGGIDLRSLSFERLYELRAENTLGGFAGYWFNWCAKVFFPFYLGLFATRVSSLKMKLTGTLAVVAMQFLLYLSFGYKAYLFSIFFAIAVYVGMRSRRFVEVVMGGVSALAILAIPAYRLLGSELLSDTLLMRTLFHPAEIQNRYFEWFQHHDFLWFSDNMIGQLLGRPQKYPDGLTYVIGSYFSDGNVRVNANTGVFSDAYANGGFLVMVASAAALGIMFLAVDRITLPRDVTMTVVTLSYWSFTLNDTPLTTAFLTGGYILLVGLLYFGSSRFARVPPEGGQR